VTKASMGIQKAAIMYVYYMDCVDKIMGVCVREGDCQ